MKSFEFRRIDDNTAPEVMSYDEVYYDCHRNTYTTRIQTEQIRELEKKLTEQNAQKKLDLKNLISYYYTAR